MARETSNPASKAMGAAAALDDFWSGRAPLVKWLHAKAGASRWGVTPERFAEVLRHSAKKRFAAATPSASEMAAYLEELHVEDLGLACACRDGCEPAWEFFFANYRETLYSAARAIMGGARANEAQARELADSLYADLFGTERNAGGRRSLFEYFHGRSKLSTWLRAVLAQRHIDALRAGRRTESLDEPRHGPDGQGALRSQRTHAAADPDRQHAVACMQAAMTCVLTALSARDRLRLALYYVQDLTLAQIGKLLGEHEASVSRHLERTRKELRRRTEETLRGENRLSDAQVRQCFAYALEEWPFDLTAALEKPDPSLHSAGWGPAQAAPVRAEPVQADRVQAEKGQPRRGES
jgi:RNA polymerase sigma-70 factor (ECF subfamily)